MLARTLLVDLLNRETRWPVSPALPAPPATRRSRQPDPAGTDAHRPRQEREAHLIPRKQTRPGRKGPIDRFLTRHPCPSLWSRVTPSPRPRHAFVLTVAAAASPRPPRRAAASHAFRAERIDVLDVARVLTAGPRPEGRTHTGSHAPRSSRRRASRRSPGYARRCTPCRIAPPWPRDRRRRWQGWTCAAGRNLRELRRRLAPARNQLGVGAAGAAVASGTGPAASLSGRDVPATCRRPRRQQQVDAVAEAVVARGFFEAGRGWSGSSSMKT